MKLLRIKKDLSFKNLLDLLEEGNIIRHTSASDPFKILIYKPQAYSTYILTMRENCFDGRSYKETIKEYSTSGSFVNVFFTRQELINFLNLHLSDSYHLLNQEECQLVRDFVETV